MVEFPRLVLGSESEALLLQFLMRLITSGIPVEHLLVDLLSYRTLVRESRLDVCEPGVHRVVEGGLAYRWIVQLPVDLHRPR